MKNRLKYYSKWMRKHSIALFCFEILYEISVNISYVYIYVYNSITHFYHHFVLLIVNNLIKHRKRIIIYWIVEVIKTSEIQLSIS